MRHSMVIVVDDSSIQAASDNLHDVSMLIATVARRNRDCMYVTYVSYRVGYLAAVT